MVSGNRLGSACGRMRATTANPLASLRTMPLRCLPLVVQRRARTLALATGFHAAAELFAMTLGLLVHKDTCNYNRVLEHESGDMESLYGGAEVEASSSGSKTTVMQDNGNSAIAFASPLMCYYGWNPLLFSDGSLLMGEKLLVHEGCNWPPCADFYDWHVAGRWFDRLRLGTWWGWCRLRSWWLHPAVRW